jgi:putative Holliday junction resolvase
MTPGEQPRQATGRRLGLDLGEARIGIAASDEGATMAFARGVLERRGPARDLQELLRLTRAEGAVEVVIGLPLRADGSEGDRARRARRFARRLEATLRGGEGGGGIAVILADERLSTVEAEANLRQAGLDARQQRGRIDAEAARVLLQRYLDRIRREEAGP